jgi:hypothetical protein
MGGIMTEYGARTVVALIFVLVLAVAVWMFRWDYTVLPGVAVAGPAGDVSGDLEFSSRHDSVAVRTNRFTGTLQVLMCRRADRWIPSVWLARTANDGAVCQWL